MSPSKALIHLVILATITACGATPPPAAPLATAPPKAVDATPPPAAIPTPPAPPPARAPAPPAPSADPAPVTMGETPKPPARPVVALAPGATDTPAIPVAPTPNDEEFPALSTDQKAFVTGQLLGTEVVFVTVADASATCESVAKKAPPSKGARMAELRVLWKTGYYDFSNRMAQGKLATYQGTFWLKEDATAGGIQVRAAPLQQGSAGRIHVKASRPGSAQSMDAELGVTVCTPIDFTKKGK